jgi:hypothetical protein
MELSQAERTRYLDKLEALSNIRIDRGSTEAETINAAAAIRRISEEYGLTMDDVRGAQRSGRADDLIESQRDPFYSQPVCACLWYIACYTNTRIWIERHYAARALRRTWQKDFVYVGAPADVEAAKYLVRLFARSIETAWTLHWAEARYDSNEHWKTARASFERGMTSRLNHRLERLFTAREKSAAADSESRELVVITQQLIETKIKSMRVVFTKPRQKGWEQRYREHRFAESEHYEAGYEAGKTVNLVARGEISARR